MIKAGLLLWVRKPSVFLIMGTCHLSTEEAKAGGSISVIHWRRVEGEGEMHELVCCRARDETGELQLENWNSR